MGKGPVILIVLSLMACCKTVPLKPSISAHPFQQENFEFENNGDARFKNTADDSQCRLQTFVSNFSMVGMGYMIISPRNPIRFAYCRGSCHFPFSLDAGDDSYVTADMLIRHLAILKGLSLSDDEKDMFKASYCVPVEYTSLRVVLGTETGVRKKLWIGAIPRKCGCR